MLYFQQGVVSITDACNYEALPGTHLQGGRHWDPKLTLAPSLYPPRTLVWKCTELRRVCSTEETIDIDWLFSPCLKINWWIGVKLQRVEPGHLSDSCFFLACCLFSGTLSSIRVPIGVLALERGAVGHVATSRQEKGIAPPTRRNPVLSQGCSVFVAIPGEHYSDGKKGRLRPF